MRNWNVNTHSPRIGSRGFALIEALAVLALSAVVITASMGLLGQSSSFTGDQSRSEQGFFVLQNLSESLMLANGGDAALSAGEHTLYYDLDGKPLKETGPISVVYNVTADKPMVGLTEIRIEARWKSDGKTRVKGYSFFRKSPTMLADGNKASGYITLPNAPKPAPTPPTPVPVPIPPVQVPPPPQPPPAPKPPPPPPPAPKPPPPPPPAPKPPPPPPPKPPPPPPPPPAPKPPPPPPPPPAPKPPPPPPPKPAPKPPPPPPPPPAPKPPPPPPPPPAPKPPPPPPPPPAPKPPPPPPPPPAPKPPPPPPPPPAPPPSYDY